MKCDKTILVRNSSGLGDCCAELLMRYNDMAMERRGHGCSEFLSHLQNHPTERKRIHEAVLGISTASVLCNRMSYRTPNVSTVEQNELREPESINQRVEVPVADNIQSNYTALRYPDLIMDTEEGGRTQI